MIAPSSDRPELQHLLEGQYLLERELGRGGMGIVYLAREIRLDRPVAIKVLPRETGANPELRERFLREARTAAQLSHPNIVPIFRADEVGGVAFFTMGFVDGESLAERLRVRGPFAPAAAVRVLRETAWALAYAHARGVVHRDVKPENIMLERDSGRVIVTDFGIARDQRASALTQTGMVLGSAHYMSPEQAAGDAVDGRSDLYALGVVGFEMLAGRRPFEGDQAAAVMAQQVTRTPPLLAAVAPGVPGPLAHVIDRCLSKAPADRYPSGEALADALAAALEAATPAADAAGTPETVSTTEAQAIWLRAAQLQAEATSRLQGRYRASAASGAPVISGGYHLKEVQAAAVEAGIASQYVAMALAERPADRTTDAVGLTGSDERLMTRMLGTPERSISLSRDIHASPKAVLEAIGRIVTAPPFRLRLRDTVGGHPLDGGIMVFDVPMLRTAQIAVGENAAHSLFSIQLTQIDLHQLNIVLRPLGSPAESCRVTVSGDLRKGLRRHWRVDRRLAAGSAVAGGGLGVFVGVTTLPLGPLTALTAAAGGALFGWVAAALYRWAFRVVLRRGADEIESLLGAVDGSLRAASLFGAPSPPDAGHPLSGPTPTTPA